MAVKAELVGGLSDLVRLALMLPTGDPWVDQDADLYFLVSKALEVSMTEGGGPLQEAAERMLAQVNGLARIEYSPFQPVRLAGRYVDGRGRRMTVVKAGIAEGRCEVLPVTVSGGADVRTEPAGPRRMRRAGSDENVAELLDLLGGTEEPTWSDLYKAFEIIRDGVGAGRDGLVDRGWTTRREIGSFTGSANHPTVSGAAARHARLPGTPQETMTIGEGRNYIMELAKRWLDSN